MILITRPLKEAKILKSLLTEKGYNSHIFSLSRSMHIQSTVKIKKNYVALLTSMRATEIFIKSKYISKRQPIMVIGAKSSKQLNTAGFNNVLHCAKDSNAMIGFIEKKLSEIYKKKNYKGIEYCSGYQINQNFFKKLNQYNIPVKRTVLYKMNFKKSKEDSKENYVKLCDELGEEIINTVGQTKINELDKLKSDFNYTPS